MWSILEWIFGCIFSAVFGVNFGPFFGQFSIADLLVLRDFLDFESGFGPLFGRLFDRTFAHDFGGVWRIIFRSFLR